jgi:hypothetical protein
LRKLRLASLYELTCHNHRTTARGRAPLPRGHARLPCLVCTENPEVMVMESAEDGARLYASGPLNRANNRRVLVQRRCVLTKL